MQTTRTSNSATVALIYSTCPDLEAALLLGRTVIGEGLAACVNCIPGMRSIYQWEGAIQESAEVVLLLKTTAQKTAPLMQRLAALHPYTIPCILELPLHGVHPGFAGWVASIVRDKDGPGLNQS